MSTPLAPAEYEYFSPDELKLAYKKARLRYQGITFYTALTSPLIYKSLTMQVKAMRKEQQQHGTPAPTLQAA